MRWALTNCLLVDGTGAMARPDTTVVVDGDTIVEVSSRTDLDGVHATDLGGLTVMPGLIDCHIHFAPWFLDPLAHQDSALSYLSAKTFSAMRGALLAGCTTARDPGGLDAGFRDAVAAGLCPGPRLQTSVNVVSPINGIVDGTKAQGIPVPYPPGMPAPECTGPWQARAKVREVLRSGADFVKIAATGGISSARVAPTQRLFTDEELAAIVDEAHAWGVPVICHAHGGAGAFAAVQAGVDTIEHGGWLDERCLDEMARRGTWYVPTFAIYHWHATQGAEFKKRRALEMRDSHREAFRRARAAGVRIAAGSDAGVYGHDFSLELELLAEAGMPAPEVVATATSKAAECLGWADEIGTVEPGKKADLLVVAGDPTKDVGVLRRTQNIRRVIKAGALISGSPDAFLEGENER